MSTIERLAKMVQETTPDQWVSIFSELHEKNCELEQQLEAAERRNAELVALLKVAACPANCIGGAYHGHYGEPIQCQFCYERDAALAHSAQEKTDAAE